MTIHSFKDVYKFIYRFNIRRINLFLDLICFHVLVSLLVSGDEILSHCLVPMYTIHKTNKKVPHYFTFGTIVYCTKLLDAAQTQVNKKQHKNACCLRQCIYSAEFHPIVHAIK